MSDKIKLYGVKDKKAGFTEVMECENDAILCRQVSQLVNDSEKKTLIAIFPEDFSVYKIAEINRETGEIKADLHKVTECKDWAKTEK